MNARRKRRQRAEMRRDRKREAQPLVAICGRCGVPFSPSFLEELEVFSKHCEPCLMMNLVDAIFSHE
jgi:hypothetical protein